MAIGEYAPLELRPRLPHTCTADCVCVRALDAFGCRFCVHMITRLPMLQHAGSAIRARWMRTSAATTRGNDLTPANEREAEFLVHGTFCVAEGDRGFCVLGYSVAHDREHPGVHRQDRASGEG